MWCLSINDTLNWANPKYYDELFLTIPLRLAIFPSEIAKRTFRGQYD